MKKEDTAEAIDRRAFLIRVAKAGACAAATGAGAWLLHKEEVRTHTAEDAGAAIPDYSLTGRKPALVVVRGASRERTLQRAVSGLGGIETFVSPGDRVLIKVNAAFASPPSLSATSHPDLVAAAVRMCRKAGAASVSVTDNPINDPASCFALTGIEAAARSAGAEVILPREKSFAAYTVPGATLIRRWPVLIEPLLAADKVIGLAPLKDHHRSGASMTLKNWYGLLGGRRNIFHQDVHTVIKELAMMIRPTLVVLDATTAMVSNGPTGGSLSDLKRLDTLIAGTDPVAVDAYGAHLLERPIAELAFIALAEQAVLGTADWRSLHPDVMDL